jgi:hypothetical protein
MTDVYIPTDDGQWVSEKFERLARLIKDYDPDLELRWIPPAMRTREDKKPYCVVHFNPQNGKEYIVLHASELDTPEQILAKLWGADAKNGDVLKNLDIQNDAAEALKMKERRDLMEEANSQAEFLHRSPINYLKWGKDKDGRLIKMDDERRRI